MFPLFCGVRGRRASQIPKILFPSTMPKQKGKISVFLWLPRPKGRNNIPKLLCPFSNTEKVREDYFLYFCGFRGRRATTHGNMPPFKLPIKKGKSNVCMFAVFEAERGLRQILKNTCATDRQRAGLLFSTDYCCRC